MPFHMVRRAGASTGATWPTRGGVDGASARGAFKGALLVVSYRRGISLTNSSKQVNIFILFLFAYVTFRVFA